MNPQPPATETARKKRQAQPKTHAPKGRLAASLRRKQIIKGITQGKTNRQAGIDSGLSPKTAAAQVTAILKDPETQLTLRTAMERLGVDDTFLAERHKELLNGKRYIPARGDNPGSEIAPGYLEIPDNQSLARGLELAYKLQGRFMERHEVDMKPPVKIIIKKFCSRQNSTGPAGDQAA